jgi:DNA-binding IclR family transcriptional regulator
LRIAKTAPQGGIGDKAKVESQSMAKPAPAETVAPSARAPLQTVIKALATLRLFTVEREWLGVREIGRMLDLNSATVHNLLRTLAGSGLVEQHPETRKYRLGLGLVKLAGTKLAQLDLVTAASGPMKELMERTRETITLSVLYGSDLLYLAKFESPQPVRVASRIGGGAPIHASANGKALLAFVPDDEVERLLAPPLRRFTSDTVTDARRIRTELRTIRTQDYAVDFGGYIAGVHAVAAPVRDSTGSVVASLGIVAPAGRLAASKVKAFATLAREAAGRISTSLGWSAAARQWRASA